ncbi:MAG: hypothetical protein ACYDCL_14540 [Myxococcales bacterium]
MVPALWLLLAAAGPDGLAPLGPGYAGAGSRADVVLRPVSEVAAGRSVELKLLVSDALTDAPVSAAKVSLRLFGPQGSADLAADARAAALPGHYLARVTPLVAGSEAFVASVAGDLVAGDGVAVAAASVPAPRRRSWPWASLCLGCAGMVLVLRRRPALLALCLLCSAAGDARAHGAYTPPPAAVPGADVYVAQEIQFALGLRTARGQIESFEPEGGEGAPRRFLAVPRSAIVERGGHELLFVRLAPERFVAREPKLGWETESDGADEVAVLSGLELDENVVVRGAAFLGNGGAVTP